mmetsp:Transcript_17657/g.24535  ORF Transcript_17657/g.24535 Transcript_17657/m.24535 type:complete len:473 (+) Transcript_17657:1-1419(+)
MVNMEANNNNNPRGLSPSPSRNYKTWNSRQLLQSLNEIAAANSTKSKSSPHMTMDINNPKLTFIERNVIRGQRVWRNYQKRKKLQRWRKLVIAYSKSPQSESTRIRNLTKKEIMASEAKFLENMNFLHKNYKVVLEKLISEGKPILVQQQIEALFSNFEEIRQFSFVLTSKYEEIRQDMTAHIGQIFQDFLLPNLQLFIPYILNFGNAMKTYSELKHNQLFTKFEHQVIQDSPGHWPLIDYLLMPVQRLLQIKILIGRLKDFTPLEHVDYSTILSAYHGVDSIYERVKQHKATNENNEEVLRIQQTIKGCPELATPTRKFIKGGLMMIHIPTSKKKFYEKLFVFLFNDLLLLARPLPTINTDKNEFLFLESVHLETIASVDDIAANRSLFEISFIQKKEKFLMNASTVNEKNEWMQTIQQTLKKLASQDEDSELTFHNHKSLQDLFDSELQGLQAKTKKPQVLFSDVSEGFF